MLLVLKPLPLIAFAVRERINAIALAPPLDVFSFVGVAILEDRVALSVGLTVHHLPLILPTVVRHTRA